jgi:hypothetical protein
MRLSSACCLLVAHFDAFMEKPFSQVKVPTTPSHTTSGFFAGRYTTEQLRSVVR